MQRRDFITATAGVVAGGAAGLTAGGAMAAERGDDVTQSSRSTRSRQEPHLIDVAAFHDARRFMQTEFGRIAYVERGAGPVALFLHGLPLNGYQWRGALERLWPHRRCIAPDFMGLGYTEVAEGRSLAPAEQARMIAGLLDALRIDAVDIVSNDSGNAVAQLFAAWYPDRLRTLLLTNGDAHDYSPPPAVQPVIAAAREGRFADDVLLPQLADRSMTLQPSGLGGCCYTDPEFMTRELLEVYLRPLVRSEPRKALFHQYCIEMEPNPLPAIEGDLRRCLAPLRVVWGTGDDIFSPAAAEWLDRTFPNSRGVRWVAGGNLFFPEEFPDLIASEARRLWGVDQVT